MIWAAILFSLTGLGGAVLASFPLRGIPRPPTWLALGHGGLAIASFATLFSAGGSAWPQLAVYALLVLLLAAAGGATLFLGFHLRAKALPKILVIGHGMLAICGVALLWFSILR